MITTQETCPSVAAPEREAGTAAIDTVAAPADDFTCPSGKDQALRIADFLTAGEMNALPMRHLKSILHRDGRTIRLMIEAERRQGVPILSNCQTGYYLAADEGEVGRFVRSMRHRAFEILRTAAAIEKSTERANGN